MKKTLLTLIVGLFTSLFSVGATLDGATWYSGSTWLGATQMVNRSANSLTMIFGVLNNATTVTMPDYYEAPNTAMKVQITNPDGSTYSSYPTPITYMGYNDQGAYTQQKVENGFKFTVSSYGTNATGTYTVVIPAGCITVDGSPIEATTIEFYVNDNRTFTPIDINFSISPDPDFEVRSLTGVRLSYNINYANGDRRFVAESPSTSILPYFEKADGTKINATAKNIGSSTGFGSIDISAEDIISEEGVYTLHVPQGALRFKEQGQGSSSSVTLVCNKELTYTYTVTGDKGYPAIDQIPIISPTPGKLVKLTRLQFESPNDNTDLYLPEEILPIQMKYPNGTQTTIKPYTNANVEGLFAFVDLGTACEAPGIYSFTVPRGCFEYYINEQFYVNSEFKFNYEVIEVTTRDFNYTATPADGSTMYFFDNISLYFADTDLTFSTGTKATLTYPSGKTTQCSITFGQENSRLIVDPGYPTEYGEYTVTIPAFTVLDAESVANNEITLHYTYAERLPADVAFKVSPAEGIVGELDLISITAPADVDKLETTYGGITRVYFRDNDGQETMYYLKSTNNVKTFRVELDETVTEEGDYALIVPEAVFRVYMADGTQCLNTACVFTWTVSESGLDHIYSETGLYDVYTISGVKVATGATAESLSDLKGVYIVNGKTTILR